MSSLSEKQFEGADWLTIRRRLGAGGFGVVYEAYDQRRQGIVALKTLHEFAPAELYMLKQEFRAMADVTHPNLAMLYDLVLEGERCFFTMELIDGVDLLAYLRQPEDPEERADPQGISSPALGARETGHPVPMDRVRDVFAQLAEGVCALHEADILHRDLKPSNVLVGKDGRVVVLDFGLAARAIFGDVSRTEHLIGTVAYISPEQAAGEPLASASDWYSVGVMLYEALTGRCPFSGPLLEILAEKQRSEAPPPREVNPEIPGDLNDLCQGLLRRDPRARPAGREVVRLLSQSRDETLRVLHKRAEVSGPASLVGREGHQRVLGRAFDVVKEGRPVTVHVLGKSGMGKTALIRHFLRGLRQRERDVVVLAGRCHEQESVPYKALDSLVDSLSRYLRHLPPLRAERMMPRDVLALARLFPVLRNVEAVASTRGRVVEVPDVQELRRRAGKALRELLARIADESPLVLFIDDLHWGDLDSALLLNELVRPPDPPVLLLVICYRSEEAEDNPLLRRVREWPAVGGVAGETVELEVGELGPSQAQRLALSLLGEERSRGEARAEAIARESGGSPFLVEALVRHAAGERDAGAQEASLSELIRVHTSLMPEDARRLLGVVAVAGRPLDLEVARTAAGLQAEEDPAVSLLRAQHLVRTRVMEGHQEIEIYHDRIREALIAQLPTDVSRAHHRSLARAWESAGRGDPETLAMHWRGAGELEQAAEYAALAAEQADQALAFDRAARLYRLALELWPVEATEERSLRVRIADALANAGRGAEAAAAFLKAAEDAVPADSLEFRRRAAEQLLISGHVDEGLAVLRQVLAMVGMKLARTPKQALLGMAARRAQLRIRGLRFRERDESQLSVKELTRIDTCWSVMIGLGMVDTVRAVHFQARHLRLALQAGEPYRIARALAWEASSTAVRGSRSHRRTEQLLKAGWALAERTENPHALGMLALAAGTSASFRGRFREAIEMCERAELVLRERCKGVVWELDTAELYRMHSLYWLGSWKEISERLPTLMRESLDRRDLYLATFLGTRSSLPMYLAADRPDEAREEQQRSIGLWSHQGFQVQHAWDWLSQCEIDLYAGREHSAWRRVRQVWPVYSGSALHFAQPLFIETLYLRARAALARVAGRENAPEGREARKLLRRVERDARRIEREGTAWGNALARLVRACVAASAGDPESAAALAGSADQELRSVDMNLHAAAARRRRGELLGGDEGRALVEASDAWMTGQAIKDPGRITAMLAPGSWR
jgi:predicted ATPase